MGTERELAGRTFGIAHEFGAEEFGEGFAGIAAFEIAFHGSGDGAGFLGNDNDDGVAVFTDADAGAVAHTEVAAEIYVS